MGFDPRNIKDSYTNYFTNNQHHTLINRAYCKANPLHFTGYGADCWGLTASDDPDGYAVHEPSGGRDNGTISPTAALSSMPYTPMESLSALKSLYRTYGDKIWGWMGFYDAFNLSRNWFADSYLAIDQGPIINMIENSRSQLLWNNFMANPEIHPMLTNIGFTEDITGIDELSANNKLTIYPNPVEADQAMISIKTTSIEKIDLNLYDIQGRLISNLLKNQSLTGGKHSLSLNYLNLRRGIYLIRCTSSNFSAETYKLIIK